MKTLVCLLAFALATSMADTPPTESHREAAKRLITVVRVVSTAKEAMFAVVERQLQALDQNGVSDESIGKIRQAASDLGEKIFSDGRFLEATIALYTKEFTEEEMKAIIAFYETPLGQKTLDKLPDLLQAGSKISEALAQEAMPTFHKKLEEILAAEQAAKAGKDMP